MPSVIACRSFKCEYAMFQLTFQTTGYCSQSIKSNEAISLMFTRVGFFWASNESDFFQFVWIHHLRRHMMKQPKLISVQYFQILCYGDWKATWWRTVSPTSELVKTMTSSSCHFLKFKLPESNGMVIIHNPIYASHRHHLDIMLRQNDDTRN